MTDAADRPIHEGDRVRVHAPTPSSRHGTRVGWAVKVVEVAQDDERDVAGVLVAFTLDPWSGAPWFRGWACWRPGREVDVLEETT